MSKKTHIYFVGKADYCGRGRKDCPVEIEWSFENGRFSMSGCIWNPRKTDGYSFGQNLDSIAELFPANKKVQRMVAIWQEWHLNHLTAGSPAQEAFLEANPIPKEEYAYPKSHYDVACAKLAAAGLNPDHSFMKDGKPYAYGSANNMTEIPAEVAEEINSWSNQPVAA